MTSNSMPRLSISNSKAAACFFHSGVSRTLNVGSLPWRPPALPLCLRQPGPSETLDDQGANIAAAPIPKAMIICVASSAAESSLMASQRHSRWTGNYPPGSPAEWPADGHVTCNIQCSGVCDRRMVNVRLDTLPQDLPWSAIGRRLVCKQCGADMFA